MMVQKVNVTLSNESPLISYSPMGAWSEGLSATDILPVQWLPFAQTSQRGAAAGVTFNGTAVWIYGAKGDNQGLYNVTLDDKTYYEDGYSSVYYYNSGQVLFFSGVGLASRLHSLFIVNLITDTAKPYLDIDSIVYEVEVPDEDKRNTQDDTDSAFQFSPSAWNTNPLSLASYHNGTGHTTSAQGASVAYTFQVEIYGAVGPSSGVYTVQVDNSDAVTFNGTKSALIPQTLLYASNVLVPGSHTVKILNSPYAGQTLNIDYAVIFGSISSTDDDASKPSSSSTGGVTEASGNAPGSSPSSTRGVIEGTGDIPESSPSLSGGVIGAIAIGGCAGILLILVGIFLWRRRRNRRPGPIPTEDHSNPSDYDTGPVTFHTPTLPTTVERCQPLTVSALTDTGLLQPLPAPNLVPSPPHSNSSASNSDSRSRLFLHNPNHSLTGSGHGVTLGPALGSLPASENPGTSQTPGRVMRPLPQPESSNPRLHANALTLPPFPDDDLRSTRMRVEGRLQDFGPIDFVLDAERDENLLPPDYYQATQPSPSRRR